MDYQQTLDYIHSIKRFGKKPGLQRIKELLDLLGNPQSKLQFVHVAGTNGKGSTTRMISGVLQEAGYRTGMFISPFVLDFRERMQVNGQMITKDDLCSVYERVKAAALTLEKQGKDVAEFEVVTAGALLWFAQQQCDLVVLEVGIGGRFDATNVIDTPLVSVITSISMDHTEILGDTIGQIAFEKCGIIKRGGVTVSYPLQQPEAMEVIQRRTQEEGNRLIVGDVDAVTIHSTDLTGSAFAYRGKELLLPLAGIHQIYNCITALEAIEVLRQKNFAISDINITNGIKKSRFPARMEVLRQQPLVVLDGAHNFSGAKALADNLAAFDQRDWVAITGILGDKDADGVLEAVAPFCRELITVPPKTYRAVDPAQLAARAEQFCPCVFPIHDEREAFRLALEHAGPDGKILIFGSLYLAADLRTIVLSPEFDR